MMAAYRSRTRLPPYERGRYDAANGQWLSTRTCACCTNSPYICHYCNRFDAYGMFDLILSDFCAFYCEACWKWWYNRKFYHTLRRQVFLLASNAQKNVWEICGERIVSFSGYVHCMEMMPIGRRTSSRCVGCK